MHNSQFYLQFLICGRDSTCQFFGASANNTAECKLTFTEFRHKLYVTYTESTFDSVVRLMSYFPPSNLTQIMLGSSNFCVTCSCDCLWSWAYTMWSMRRSLHVQHRFATNLSAFRDVAKSREMQSVLIATRREQEIVNVHDTVAAVQYHFEYLFCLFVFS